MRPRRRRWTRLWTAVAPPVEMRGQKNGLRRSPPLPLGGRGAKRGRSSPVSRSGRLRLVSPRTTTFTSTTTSVCGATVTVCSPTVFSGPLGMRTCAFATLKSMRLSASAMSALVTEPNRRPSTPAFCVMWTVRPLIFSPSACAAASLLGGLLLELDALVLELLDRGRGRAPGGALRDQEVAGVAVLDLDDVAEVAEVGDLLQKNDLHGVVLRPCAGRCTAASPGNARA